MFRFCCISLLFLASCADLAPAGELNQLAACLPPPKVNSFPGKYFSSPPKQLFYPTSVMALNPDSTFTYTTERCLAKDSSFGKWRCEGNVVSFRHSAAFKKKCREGDPFGRISYSDISNTKAVVFSNSIVLLGDGINDTLYKRAVY